MSTPTSLSARPEAAGPESYHVAFHVFLWAIMLLLSLETIFGNILVLASYVVDRSLRQPSNLFIASLAISDLIIGLEGFPILTIYVLNGERWTLGRIACQLWLSLDYALCLVSILTVLLITVDRYLSVVYPIMYRKWQTEEKVQVMIVLSWLFPIILFTAMIFGWQTPDPSSNSTTHLVADDKCYAPFLDHPYVNLSMYLTYYWTTLVAMVVLYRGIHKTAQALEERGKAKEKQHQAMAALQQCMAQMGVGLLCRANDPDAAQQRPIAEKPTKTTSTSETKPELSTSGPTSDQRAAPIAEQASSGILTTTVDIVDSGYVEAQAATLSAQTDPEFNKLNFPNDPPSEQEKSIFAPKHNSIRSKPSAQTMDSLWSYGTSVTSAEFSYADCLFGTACELGKITETPLFKRRREMFKKASAVHKTLDDGIGNDSVCVSDSDESVCSDVLGGYATECLMHGRVASGRKAKRVQYSASRKVKPEPIDKVRLTTPAPDGQSASSVGSPFRSPNETVTDSFCSDLETVMPADWVPPQTEIYSSATITEACFEKAPLVLMESYESAIVHSHVTCDESADLIPRDRDHVTCDERSRLIQHSRSAPVQMRVEPKREEGRRLSISDIPLMSIEDIILPTKNPKLHVPRVDVRRPTVVEEAIALDAQRPSFLRIRKVDPDVIASGVLDITKLSPERRALISKCRRDIIESQKVISVNMSPDVCSLSSKEPGDESGDERVSEKASTANTSTITPASLSSKTPSSEFKLVLAQKHKPRRAGVSVPVEPKSTSTVAASIARKIMPTVKPSASAESRLAQLFGNQQWLQRRRKQTHAEKRARKAFKTITIILGSFVFFWSPYYILATMYDDVWLFDLNFMLMFGFCADCVPNWLFLLSYYMCYVNSSLNPFCYALANRQYRTAFLRILRGDFQRR